MSILQYKKQIHILKIRIYIVKRMEDMKENTYTIHIINGRGEIKSLNQPMC